MEYNQASKHPSRIYVCLFLRSLDYFHVSVGIIRGTWRRSTTTRRDHHVHVLRSFGGRPVDRWFLNSRASSFAMIGPFEESLCLESHPEVTGGAFNAALYYFAMSGI